MSYLCPTTPYAFLSIQHVKLKGFKRCMFAYSFCGDVYAWALVDLGTHTSKSLRGWLCTFRERMHKSGEWLNIKLFGGKMDGNGLARVFSLCSDLFFPFTTVSLYSLLPFWTKKWWITLILIFRIWHTVCQQAVKIFVISIFAKD